MSSSLTAKTKSTTVCKWYCGFWERKHLFASGRSAKCCSHGENQCGDYFKKHTKKTRKLEIYLVHDPDIPWSQYHSILSYS